jgi:Flp pilus assembly protein TadB
MDRVPEVGGARGIFEIFVPGAFLLLNLATAAYLWPFTSDPVRDQLASFYSNASVSLLASITLGYLLGVVLRLLRSEMPDRLSARFLRLTDRRTYGGETDKNRYAYERFPFTLCMRTVCEDLMPPRVRQFYETVWAPRDSKHFFNLCKLIVASEDPKAAQEIYSSEALCRHISGMFYALAASLAAMLSVGIAIWVHRGSPSFLLVFVVLVYLVAIVVILSNFRFMRLKEVETVFAASYRNCETIQDALKAGATEGAEQAGAADAASPRR